MAVSMGTTSVPRWSVRVSDVDAVLADGSVACVVFVVDTTVPDTLLDELVSRSVPVAHVVRIDETNWNAMGLDDLLADARVGWRFVVVGAEAAVGRIRATVLAAGAIDSEVIVVTTEAPDIASMRRRDVFCGHCHVVSGAVTAVDGVVRCAGCDVELTVYYHYSRRHSAYLGYRADSEDVS